MKRKPVEPVNESTICNRCKKTGHIARNCFERQKRSKAMERTVGGVKVIQIDDRVETFCGKCYKWGHPIEKCMFGLCPLEGSP